VFGIGIFPEALIVLAIKGQWGLAGMMVLHFIAVIAMRLVGAYAIGSYQRERESLAAVQRSP
jgi:hypothetical protein